LLGLRAAARSIRWGFVLLQALKAATACVDEEVTIATRPLRGSW
jgi:hypothetical protein